MAYIGILRTAVAVLALTARTTHARTAATMLTSDIHERADSSNKTICGTETGASGLKTNWYCAGEEPVCCRDSTTTWDEGIPWACIPADGLCCGHGDYCSSGSTCVRDGSDYACRSSSGHELSSLVGNTPEGESDWSGVDGGDDDDDDDKKGAASTLRLRLPMMEACGIALGVMLLL